MLPGICPWQASRYCSWLCNGHAPMLGRSAGRAVSKPPIRSRMECCLRWSGRRFPSPSHEQAGVEMLRKPLLIHDAAGVGNDRWCIRFPTLCLFHKSLAPLVFGSHRQLAAPPWLSEAGLGGEAFRVFFQTNELDPKWSGGALDPVPLPLSQCLDGFLT